MARACLRGIARARQPRRTNRRAIDTFLCASVGAISVIPVSGVAWAWLLQARDEVTQKKAEEGVFFCLLQRVNSQFPDRFQLCPSFQNRNIRHSKFHTVRARAPLRLEVPSLYRGNFQTTRAHRCSVGSERQIPLHHFQPPLLRFCCPKGTFCTEFPGCVSRGPKPLENLINYALSTFQTGQIPTGNWDLT